MMLRRRSNPINACALNIHSIAIFIASDCGGIELEESSLLQYKGYGEAIVVALRLGVNEKWRDYPTLPLILMFGLGFRRNHAQQSANGEFTLNISCLVLPSVGREGGLNAMLYISEMSSFTQTQ